MLQITARRLLPDLVVLSACESARGPLVRGEGIEGLSRAFFYAGASAVMMSLWGVDDQAGAQFMERFYDFLGKGDSIVDAQRKAKLEMIGNKEAAHPYFWANIVVSGEAERKAH
jgi:CHAT domain-containing protein